ncbi:hypothetical protein FRC06_001695 [Ceratobasidium sp. 370]|nr:hypothetical protein FRC06_001695 [Ceratobasidium sp. 370]
MTTLSATLRSRALWWTNLGDQVILDKWRAEALEQAKLTKESHINYVLKELDGYAKLRDEESGAEVGVLFEASDGLVPESIKAKLVAGVAQLENTLNTQKDWRPRSNGLVLDLVHPSLYPVVYNRTLAYPPQSTNRDATKLKPIPPPKLRMNRTGNYHISQNFGWLPTDFVVSGNGKSVKSVSYINNLNPDQHNDLHKAIEEVIGRFLPLFERVLTDSIPNNKAIPERMKNTYWDDEDYKPPPEDSGELDNKKYYKAYQEWKINRPIQLPDVPAEGYILGSLEQRCVRYKLAGRTIQVFIKLANIHLTPEKPEYPGDSWHIEGMSNEAIAVCGIYCFAEDNVTESRLAFRNAAFIPRYTTRKDYRRSMLTWGIARDDPCVNELGTVATHQDRAIAFPNSYQHRVPPFELKDKTKPGHRKIIALFLVDPAMALLSTTTVPPQQHEWRSAAISANPILKAAFDKLALETIDSINSFADGTMTRTEAEAYRLELMDEREAFVDENNQMYFEIVF